MPDDGFGDTSTGAVAPCATPTHWIEIELRDDEGNPVPNEAYKIKLPNGETNSGFLDGNGCAHLDGIEDPGTCQVSFPNMDGDDWQFESSTGEMSASGGSN